MILVWALVGFMVFQIVKVAMDHHRHRKVMRLLEESTDLARQSVKCSRENNMATAWLLMEESVTKAEEAYRLMGKK